MSPNLLFHGRKKSLGVKESRQPVRLRPARINPLEELLVSLQQPREPVSQGACLPTFLQPRGWYPGIKECIEGVDQVGIEGNGTGNGHTQALEGRRRQLGYNIQPVDLLPKVNGERLSVTTGELAKLLLGLLLIKHGWYLEQQVLTDLIDHLLPA